MPRIDCPHCGKTLEYQSIRDVPHFPFCSERCKLVDLGLWFDEKHTISEDLFDREFYIELVNKEFGKSIKPTEINASIPRVLVALQPSFGGKSFNHYRPARYFSEHLGELEEQISDVVIERFERLFTDLNGLLRK
jgi:endogenous inhibitor of DNA gyrase (YacG/DUF329 family)